MPYDAIRAMSSSKTTVSSMRITQPTGKGKSLGENSLLTRDYLLFRSWCDSKKRKITGIGRKFSTGTDFKRYSKITDRKGRDPGRFFMDASGAIYSFKILSFGFQDVLKQYGCLRDMQKEAARLRERRGSVPIRPGLFPGLIWRVPLQAAKGSTSRVPKRENHSEIVPK